MTIRWKYGGKHKAAKLKERKNEFERTPKKMREEVSIQRNTTAI